MTIVVVRRSRKPSLPAWCFGGPSDCPSMGFLAIGQTWAVWASRGGSMSLGSQESGQGCGKGKCDIPQLVT